MSDGRIRTTTMTVAFNHPFRLKGMEADHGPGTYSVDIDAECIENGSHLGYRHVATYLYLTDSGRSRMITVDDEDLKDALARDEELTLRANEIAGPSSIA